MSREARIINLAAQIQSPSTLIHSGHQSAESYETLYSACATQKLVIVEISLQALRIVRIGIRARAARDASRRASPADTAAANGANEHLELQKVKRRESERTTVPT